MAHTLTLYIDESLSAAAKDYSRAHNTSVSRLVSDYLKVVTATEDEWDALPQWVQRMRGMLPANTNLEYEYINYLEEKYL
jgi:hypothetical protein